MADIAARHALNEIGDVKLKRGSLLYSKSVCRNGNYREMH